MRKHKGINQKTGKLNKGWEYTNKILKNGYKQIVRKKIKHRSKSKRSGDCICERNRSIDRRFYYKMYFNRPQHQIGGGGNGNNVEMIGGAGSDEEKQEKIFQQENLILEELKKEIINKEKNGRNERYCL